MSIFSTCASRSRMENLVESASVAYTSIESLEEGVVSYKPSMIPVMARETEVGTKYLVEMDMLKKLDEANIYDAFCQVCEENCIDYDDTYVVVPTNEGAIDDFQISESSYLKSQIKDSITDINTLTEAGVNVLSLQGINEFGFVNKAVKNVWKTRDTESEEGGKADAKTIVNSMMSAASSVADYKFVKSKIKTLINKVVKPAEEDTAWFDEKIAECDTKISEAKAAKKNKGKAEESDEGSDE